MNEDIINPEVRLIDAEGENVGIIATDEALRIASEADLDLVEIAPNAEPPVCRLMDFGKFQYQLKQKRKDSGKKQAQVQLKEVKFRPGTEEGDYQTKLRNLRRFLDNGDKAKVTLWFRGREMAHHDLGHKLLERVEADLGEMAKIEQRPRMEGRRLSMVMSPKK